MSISPAIGALIDGAATSHGLEPRVLRALVTVESGGNPWAERYEPAFRYFWDLRHGKPFRRPDTSELASLEAPGDFWPLAGAPEQEWHNQRTSFGLGQVMGAVARELGFRGPYLSELFDPEINLSYTALKLQVELKWAGGNYRSALASYNGGRQMNQPGAPLRNEKYVVKVETAMRSIQPAKGTNV